MTDLKQRLSQVEQASDRVATCFITQLHERYISVILLFCMFLPAACYLRGFIMICWSSQFMSFLFIVFLELGV